MRVALFQQIAAEVYAHVRSALGRERSYAASTAC